MTRPIVTVVGSFAVGMTLRTSRMPIFGETLIGSDFDMGPGGKGSNQAVATARLGAQSHFVGIIGHDKLGEIATELYKAEGVNTGLMEITTARATGVGFIILNQQGENGIILDMGANELMNGAFVDRAEVQIAASDIVMTVLEIPVSAAARAMALGKQHGVKTLLNPAPATALPAEMFANVDYLTPNETEVRILLGLAPDDPTPTRDLVLRLRDSGVQTVIVTRGAEGALVYQQGAMEAVPAVGTTVVDTTGAGDAFNSALAIALAEGRDVIRAVQYANCAGALACTKLGVIPGLAQRAEVDELFTRTFG